MSEEEFETLCMIIEHLEAIEDMAYRKFEHYFDNENCDKAYIYEGLSCRANLEIQLLENYIHEVRRTEGKNDLHRHQGL